MSSVCLSVPWITSIFVCFSFHTFNMNKLLIIAFTVVAMTVLVTSDEFQGEGFHGHSDENGYKVSIEHQPYGHEHGGQGHSERFFHFHNQGNQHFAHEAYE